jgi:carbon storage regulator
VSRLVVTRRDGEAVLIGDEVIVTVVEVHGQAVRLLIEAPREMPVVRSELTGDKP